ncbi:tigger transposable element-derived protein 4-like [Ptychodera flava]|uniref:tigger transposable element-derived protein 4-like n=1 Tax=Ptychodera flava TaxID=63121 RepID=UPI003969C5D4
MSTTPRTSIKRHALSLDCKVQMIRAIESGLRHGEVCKKFDVKPSTLSTILKKKEEIIKMFEHNTVQPCRKRFRFSNVDDVEEALLKWFTSARSQNIPISGPVMQTKAEELSKKLNHLDFKASNGWLERFKSRHGISFKSVCGEAASVDESVVSDWVTSKLPKLLDGFHPRDVFNADETGLYFRLMPDKTLSFKNEVCSGGKKSKERVTVMLGANMDGSEKLKPMVIGKSKKPQCFKNLDVNSLPVIYEANQSAWMTSDIFCEWLHTLDRKFTRQKRKVLMIIDNCPAHPVVRNLRSIQLAFLPPNVTSKLQPMDQGIIKNFKCFYRRRVVERSVVALDAGKTMLNIDIKEAIDMIYSSWLKVTSETIANCFRKAQCTHVSSCDNTSDSRSENADIDTPITSSEEPSCLWETFMSDMESEDAVNFSDYVAVDDDLVVCEVPTDDDIVASVLTPNQQDDPEDTEQVDDCDVRKNDNPIPTSSTALECLSKLRHFLQSRSNIDEVTYSHLSAIEDSLYSTVCSSHRQSKITDFLTRPSH